jgi:hypothetical protein
MRATAAFECQAYCAQTDADTLDSAIENGPHGASAD